MESLPMVNEKEEENKSKPELWTATHSLTLLGLLFIALQLTVRANISVTIVPMAKLLLWDESKQALVLGSFFYGFLSTQLVGGRAAEVFGGKIVLAISQIMSSVITLLTPLAAQFSLEMLVALRVILGMAQGMAYPAMHFFLSKWVPIEEKTKTNARIFGGDQLGTFMAMFTAGWLSSSSLGWSSVFYIHGTLGLIHGFFWLLLVTDDPRNKKGISTEELNHIIEGTRLRENDGTITVPWVAILKSSSVWMTVAGLSAYTFIYHTVGAEIPTYLVNIKNFSLSQAGTISGCSYLSSWIFYLIYSKVVSLLIEKKIISITFSRRLSEVIGCYVSCFCLVCLLLTNSPPLVATFTVLLGAFNVVAISGPDIAYSDLSPRFSGTLFGIGNTFNAMTGIVVTTLVGRFTKNNQTPTAWNYVFAITILASVILATPFIFKFKAEVQEWNGPFSITARVEDTVENGETAVLSNLNEENDGDK